MTFDPNLIALARAAAARHALDPALVCAVIEQESAWNSFAMRYESAFRARYVAPLGLAITEEVGRPISWGQMQVMGQVAREHGFDGKFLSALCEPAAGLECGCRVLAAKIAIAAHEFESLGGIAVLSAGNILARALALWNGGSDPAYPEAVIARMSRYQ